MNTKEIITESKELVSTDELMKGLDLLLRHRDNYIKLENTILLLRTSLFRIKKLSMQGLVTVDDEIVKRNRIASSILSILEEIEKPNFENSTEIKQQERITITDDFYNTRIMDVEKNEEGFRLPNKKLVQDFHLPRNRITAYIHEELAFHLEDESILVDKFDEQNSIRAKQNKVKYFNSVRYRIISTPKLENGKLVLHLAPLDFAVLSIYKNPDTDSSIKKVIEHRLKEIENKIPPELDIQDQYFNPQNINLLGTEICLITSDNKILLRKRGKSVLFGEDNWDVSVSGYCGSADLINQGKEIDFSKTVQEETRREIGIIKGEPTNIMFTGIHYNEVTGANDLLGYWRIQSSAKSLRKLIIPNTIEKENLFKTNEKALEEFVWDTYNFMEEFSSETIEKALKEAGIKPTSFEPEALWSLKLALKNIRKEEIY